jgi:hypothetical protein
MMIKFTLLTVFSAFTFLSVNIANNYQSLSQDDLRAELEKNGLLAIEQSIPN